MDKMDSALKKRVVVDLKMSYMEVLRVRGISPIQYTHDLAASIWENSQNVPSNTPLPKENAIPDEIKSFLDQLSSDYSNCLDFNLTTNLLREISFLCRLLVCNYDVPDPTNVLSSLTPRIYFVTKVFENQIFLLTFLGRDICHHLINSWKERIPKSFRSKVRRYLDEGDVKLSQLEELEGKNIKYANPCVNFVSENDGKSQFLDQRDFHALSKQRDSFYDIKSNWENGEPAEINQEKNKFALPGRSNAVSTVSMDNSKRIQSLFTLNSSPTNLVHLAKLFCDQLILDMHLNENKKKQNIFEEKKALEPLLKNNLFKFKQLSSRFSPKASPHFSGSDLEEVEDLEFQKYFIQLANSSHFNQNLIDKLVFEIHEIEHFLDQKGVSEINSVIELVKKARLLSQLLGHVYFLPYHDSNPNVFKQKKTKEENEHISKLKSLRSYQSPPLDFLDLLQKAMRQQRLVFTLTWIIEFLSRADRVTFVLPKFSPILSYITFLYRRVLTHKSLHPQFKMCKENLTYLRFYFAKLFDMEYFHELNPSEFSLDGIDIVNASNGESPSLDSQPLIGISLFRNSFSVLIFEINEILRLRNKILEINSFQNKAPSPAKRISLKKITPNSKKQISEKTKIQLALEASFLQNYQPAGCRVVIEFIAERVSANYIKELKGKIIPKEQEVLEKEGKVGLVSFEAFKSGLLPRIEAEIQPKCTQAMSILIDNGIEGRSLEFCTQIAIRKCTDSIQDWVDKFAKQYFEIKDKQTQWQRRILPPARNLSFLQRILRFTHSGKGESLDLILLDSILTDFQAVVTPVVISTSLAVFFTLATYLPAKLTAERMGLFVSFWKLHSVDNVKFLCPRNVMILKESKVFPQTWSKVFDLLESLIKEGLTSYRELQEECLNLLGKEWPLEVYDSISNTLSFIIDHLKETEIDRSCYQKDDWGRLVLVVKR